VDSRGLRYGNDGLRIALQTRRREARQAAYSWDATQLLATAEADIIDYLVATYSVECPVLHPGLAAHAPVSEVNQGRVTIVTAVPFDGDREILDLCLSRPFFGRPTAQVGRGELRLRWAGRIHASAEPTGVQAKVRRYFDSQLGRVEKCLALCRGDIDWHNAWLRKLVSSVIAERKAGLMADRRLEASLGFPAPPRAEATEFAVPVARRKIETLRRPAASAPSQPEWVLPEAQYEQALAVLRYARNALERGPAMTANLDEEKIRDLLLVFLNAQFEGAASGEVFNAAGKTDILIRAEDRNVFIAECKIWNGPATIRNALGWHRSLSGWEASARFRSPPTPSAEATSPVAEASHLRRKAPAAPRRSSPSRDSDHCHRGRRPPMGKRWPGDDLAHHRAARPGPLVPARGCRDYSLRREISSDSAMWSASTARSPCPRRSRACRSSLRELLEGLCGAARSGSAPCSSMR